MPPTLPWRARLEYGSRRAVKAHAAMIDRFGETAPFRVGELDVADPVGAEVLVRVSFAAVNPVDHKTRWGLTIPADKARFPMVLGWDAAGVVEAVGPEAPDLVGTSVALLT